MTKFTVLIPTYNQEKLIIRALDSIPKRQDTRIIVVDDCSTDNTKSNVIEWADNHTNDFEDITVISTEVNSGAGVAKNIGCKMVDSEYLYIMDSDDYLFTDKFNDLLNHIDDYKDYDIIKIKNTINDGSVDIKPHTAGWSYILRNRFDIEYPTLRKTDDWEFWKALIAIGAKTVDTNIVCYHYNYPREGSIVWDFEHGITDWKGDKINA